MANAPVSFETWQNELAFQPNVELSQTPDSQGRLTGGRNDQNAQQYYAAYVQAWTAADDRTRQMIDTQHGFYREGEGSTGGGGGGGGGGPSGPPQIPVSGIQGQFIPSAPGTNYPGFQNINPQALYESFSADGIKRLDALIQDPKLRRVHATVTANSVGVPRGWRQLMATDFAEIKNFAENPPPNPYPGGLNQLIQQTLRLPNVNPSFFSPLGIQQQQTANVQPTGSVQGAPGAGAVDAENLGPPRSLGGALGGNV